MIRRFTRRRKTDKAEDRCLVGRPHRMRRYVFNGAEWLITDVPCILCDRTDEERQEDATEVARFVSEHRRS